jgi:ElaB/YqjD/DUF883 family membrane-anchored ribosome-binding protein
MNGMDTRKNRGLAVEKLDKLDKLIDGAEELLTSLADAHNPEIQRLRDRVDQAIGDTRRALARESDNGAVRLRDIAVTIDDYIRDYPWLALLTGVLVAGGIAYIAGSATGSARRSYRED